MEPDHFREFVAEFTRELNCMNAEQAAATEANRKELQRGQAKIRRLVGAVADRLPAAAARDEVQSPEARKAEREAQTAALAEPEPLVHPGLAEVYRTKVADLHLALEDETHGREAAEAIRSLIDAIVLVPDGKELRIDLKGEIASVLAIGAGTEKPADTSGLVSQIKLVAGAGNTFCRLFSIRLQLVRTISLPSHLVSHGSSTISRIRVI